MARTQMAAIKILVLCPWNKRGNQKSSNCFPAHSKKTFNCHIRVFFYGVHQRSLLLCKSAFRGFRLVGFFSSSLWKPNRWVSPTCLFILHTKPNIPKSPNIIQNRPIKEDKGRGEGKECEVPIKELLLSLSMDQCC